MAKMKYSSNDLKRIWKSYTEECNSNGRNRTFEGFAVKLQVSPSTMYRWLNGDDIKVENETDKWYAISETLKTLLAEITDDLQQSSSAMNIFRLKQKPYGGYQDIQKTESAGQLTISIVSGTPGNTSSGFGK